MMNQSQLRLLQKQLEKPRVLDWSIEGIEYTHSHSTAQLGDKNDGVTFELTYHPTCYRRGPWRLLIEIHGGPGHHLWGCFDDQDQPIRYYHLKQSLLAEVNEIARILIVDRCKQGAV